jgi:hypothetical protein
LDFALGTSDFNLTHDGEGGGLCYLDYYFDRSVNLPRLILLKELVFECDCRRSVKLIKFFHCQFNGEYSNIKQLAKNQSMLPFLLQ